MTLPDWSAADFAAAQPALDAAIYAYGLDPALIYGQCSWESHFKANAYRFESKINDASYGLMQVLYGTAQRLGYQGDPSGLFDPDVSAMLGCQLMASLLTQYEGDTTQALSAYNSGSPSSAAGLTYAGIVLSRAAWFAAQMGQGGSEPTDQGTADTIDTGGSSTTVPAIVGALLAGAVLYGLWRVVR